VELEEVPPFAVPEEERGIGFAPAQVGTASVPTYRLRAGAYQDESKAAELERWLEMTSGTFNVIPVDAWAFRAWARLMHKASDTLYEDAMIAATAKVHKFTVVTRNVADFNRSGMTVANRFVSTRK
jgi:predicted nucleic acid-binding protein